MASLVADYGHTSESSEEDEFLQQQNLYLPKAESKDSVPINYFDNQRDSTDDSSDLEEKTLNSDTRSSLTDSDKEIKKLPNPFIGTDRRLPHSSSRNEWDETNSSSVFVNPFEEAEQVKVSILEKHVRLTEAAPQKPASKQTCWKFKKGRCHLGDSCRFFHDESSFIFSSAQASHNEINSFSQALASETELVCDKSKQTVVIPRNVSHQTIPYHPAAHLTFGQPERLSDEEDNAKKTKKRCGMSDSLIPPKKALISLEKLRKKERPWTSQN